ncbi:MFS transporter [Thermococcus sp.]|uniref:MFS transporter n=1 Tax=Thermococcus sp. TaxID=35749 RepID=UPI002607207E|nr:MFS transporter [Thermococcus sp.]
MKAKELLKFEFLSQGSIGAAEGLAEAFFGVIMTRMGASAFMLGLLGSSAYVSNLFSPIWAKGSRKTGAKKLVMGSLILASLFLLMSAFTESAVPFLIFVFLYYIAYGVREVLYPLIVERVYGYLEALGHAEVAYTIAYTVAAGIAGYVMDSWGHRIAFFAASLLLLLAALSRLPFPDVKSDAEEKVEPPYRDKLILRMVAMFMVAGTGMLMMLPAIPILEVRALGLSNGVIGIAIAINSLSYVLFSELWSRLIKRPSHVVRVFQAGFTALFLMALTYYLSSSALYIYLAGVLCGLGGSAVSIGWQAFSMGVPDYRTEDLSALHLTTCGIRGLYAPILGAVFIRWLGLRETFLLAGLLLIGGIILTESVIRPLREEFEL